VRSAAKKKMEDKASALPTTPVTYRSSLVQIDETETVDTVLSIFIETT
jgi:hypothetical protein